MRVTATHRAEAQLRKRGEWWRENRNKAPDLFDREFAEAIERLGRIASSLPIYSRPRGHIVRRYLMPKTRCHLYVEVIEAVGEVLILAASGGQRRRPPRLRLQDAP